LVHLARVFTFWLRIRERAWIMTVSVAVLQLGILVVTLVAFSVGHLVAVF
jgi:hypothetical protein